MIQVPFLYRKSSEGGYILMEYSEIGWMVFVVILTFIILYQQRQIRKLRVLLSGRNSSPDKNSEPDDTTKNSGN